MWRPHFNPDRRVWEVHEDGAGCVGEPGYLGEFEDQAHAEVACRAVNDVRARKSRRGAFLAGEWKADR